MSEVVVIRITNGPIDMPIEYLSETYACVLSSYNNLLRAIRRSRGRDADFLLNKLRGTERTLRNIKRALNGKYDIIVVMDLTVLKCDGLPDSLSDCIAGTILDFIARRKRHKK